MQDFEKDVYPVVSKIINRGFRDPDLASIALVLCWYYWFQHQQSGKEAVEVHYFAHFAIRQTRAGRDLPGLQSKFRDLFDLVQWQGAGMDQARDRRPGPLEELVAREQAAALLDKLQGKQRHMADLILENPGLGTNDLAGLMGISAGRISQMRREIKERFE